jgi:hypothetical protein
MSESDLISINHEDSNGNYLSDVLLDKKIVNQVKNKGNLDLKTDEGIENSILKKLTRKNIIYYGIMQGENPITIEQATKGFQAPLVNISQIAKRLEAIKNGDREKIGFIHINTIQVIIKSTFREGIKTPIEIIVQDNRILDNECKILGKIEGDLGYTTVKFCVNLRFPIPLTTRKINNCLGIICDFKQKRLMEKGDITLVVCYRISYALSNSCLSLIYKDQDIIYTDKLFTKTSTIIQQDKIQQEFLRTHSSRFSLSNFGESSSLSIPIERPISKKTIFNNNEEIEKLNKQVTELNNVVTNLSNRI